MVAAASGRRAVAARELFRSPESPREPRRASESPREPQRGPSSIIFYACARNRGTSKGGDGQYRHTCLSSEHEFESVGCPENEIDDTRTMCEQMFMTAFKYP